MEDFFLFWKWTFEQTSSRMFLLGLYAVLMALRFLLSIYMRLENAMIMLFADNSAVVKVIRRQLSKHRLGNLLLRRIFALCYFRGARLHASWISTSLNPSNWLSRLYQPNAL